MSLIRSFMKAYQFCAIVHNHLFPFGSVLGIVLQAYLIIHFSRRICKILIDLLVIHEKSLDRTLFLYIFIRKFRSSAVIASITIVHIRKFDKM